MHDAAEQRRDQQQPDHDCIVVGVPGCLLTVGQQFERPLRIDVVIGMADGLTVPFALAATLATATDLLWSAFHLSSQPPLTRAELLLIGREVTVSDAKARQELGYQGRMSREEGLRELRADFKASAP